MSTESAFHTLCESVIEGHLNLLEALAELKDRGFGTRLEIDSFLCLVKEAAQKAKASAGMIYNWLAEERFKSWVVKRRGFERGIRYIDRASFEEFLKSITEGPAA